MRLFALVDCNNFFVSCERVFYPSLAQRPVVVLSNNDGCIVSRSSEAKALGIPMGAPLYTVKQLCAQFGVTVLSSNFELYGDLSQRVMACLRDLSPCMEVYSIDEAFLTLTGSDALKEAEKIRSRVFKWTGIPVSVGVAPTKTLAKVAAEVAKKGKGVSCLADEKSQRDVLKDLSVEDIWGIGRRWGEKLRRLGITTALQLRDADPSWIRKHFTVIGERIVFELRGISCLDLEDVQPKKSLVSSRSFGRAVTSFEELAEAISHHAAKAAVRLRQQESQAQYITVLLRTSPFRSKDSFYSNGVTLTLPVATFETSQLIKMAKEGLKQIFREGFVYHKVGVVLSGIHPMSWQQGDLFRGFSNPEPSKKLYKTLDGLNHRFGKRTVRFGAEGMDQNWQMKSSNCSPRHTTRWTELPLAYAG